MKPVKIIQKENCEINQLDQDLINSFVQNTIMDIALQPHQHRFVLKLPCIKNVSAENCYEGLKHFEHLIKTDLYGTDYREQDAYLDGFVMIEEDESGEYRCLYILFRESACSLPMLKYMFYSVADSIPQIACFEPTRARTRSSIGWILQECDIHADQDTPYKKMIDTLREKTYESRKWALLW